MSNFNPNASVPLKTDHTVIIYLSLVVLWDDDGIG